MSSFDMHVPFAVNNVAAEALDLDGATVEETGPEHPADEVDPDADLRNEHRDSDGTPVGSADAEADARR